jgi:putative endonuclease
MNQYFVYMLASKRNGTLYIGVTNDLVRRVNEHKEKIAPGFTRSHGVDILVWYETHSDINAPSRGKSKSRAGIAPGKFG